MGWSTSAAFAFAVLDVLGNGTKPTTDSYKAALYGNSITPDNTVTTAALTEWTSTGGTGQWCAATGGEVSGSGYTAGGVAVTPITVSQSGAVVTFTSSGTPTWTLATFTAYGALVYNTTNSNKGLAYIYFGGAQPVSGGTFTVTWNASGIVAFDC